MRAKVDEWMNIVSSIQGKVTRKKLPTEYRQKTDRHTPSGVELLRN